MTNNKTDNNHLFEFLYSKDLSIFVQIAGDYCLFMENANSFSKKDLIFKARELLASLYDKMINLPFLESTLEEPNPKYVTENDWDQIYSIILTKLGGHDAYLEVFAPGMQEEDRPVSASLAENFADIYQDLKNFITLYNAGDENIMNDALWECKLNFEQYWGQRLVNALRALHELSVGDYDLTDEEEKPSKNEEHDSENIDTKSWLISKKIDSHNTGKDE
jgi:hypothetical protein